MDGLSAGPRASARKPDRAQPSKNGWARVSSYVTLRFNRGLLVLALIGVSAAFLTAAETPIPEAPTRWVTDIANFMSPGALRSLDMRLQEYERGSGHQLIVYIGTTTGDAPIDDWAVRAFEKWKVGRKSIDDGLVLFIMAADRRLRIEVGYGLEGSIPDATASRIINEIITPKIQAGDRDGAVTAGMEALMSVAGGQGLPLPAQGRDRAPQPITLAQLVLYAIVGIFVLILFITNPSLAIYLLASILSGGHGHGRRHGGGWGGGGFRGGGGRSGGGGASGSW